MTGHVWLCFVRPKMKCSLLLWLHFKFKYITIYCVQYYLTHVDAELLSLILQSYTHSNKARSLSKTWLETIYETHILPAKQIKCHRRDFTIAADYWGWSNGKPLNCHSDSHIYMGETRSTQAEKCRVVRLRYHFIDYDYG